MTALESMVYDFKHTKVRLEIARLASDKKKWSMAKLASKINLDHQTVMYWNQGRSCPSLKTITKVCMVLGVTFGELMDYIKVNDQSIGEFYERVQEKH